MSMYFRSRLLHFCGMSVLYVLSMDGAVILLWVRTWRILFITTVRRSDVEHMGSRLLEFWHISFGTSVRQSDVEPPVSWRFYFGPPGSGLMSGIVRFILWLIMLQCWITDNNIIFFIPCFFKSTFFCRTCRAIMKFSYKHLQ